MSMEQSALAAIRQRLDGADRAIAAEDFERALACSADVNSMLDTFGYDTRIATDGKVRPYSIIVVAHQKVADHALLIAVLLGLDPARFELIFVENADAPIFDISPQQGAGNLRLIHLGANLGVGVARNIALRVATGAGSILIDDDGLTRADDIEQLITLFEDAQAIAVRGKVLPKTGTETPPPHYDPGTRVMQSACNIEGFSIWRTAAVVQAGGFDPILFGHEGLELTARLFPSHGPEAFLYQPTAVLRHDFYQGPQKVSEKMARYGRLSGYICRKIPHFLETLGVFDKAQTAPGPFAQLQHRIEFVRHARDAPEVPPVSILTTCYNGAAFIDDFVRGLTAQTDQNFELVFVDDGSEDDSVTRLSQALPGHIPRQIITNAHGGRGHALNTALQAAQHDTCLIADVDDIPLPQRVQWTKQAYVMFPSAALIGFMIFDQHFAARASRPLPRSAVPLSVRAYFGMPAPFPGLSFRKSLITQRFDSDLTAGIDCDWLYRTLMQDKCDGYLLPLNATFYRTHPDQITAGGRAQQQSVSSQHLRSRHGALDVPDGNRTLDMFAGWGSIENSADLERLTEYGLNILADAAAAGRPNLPDLQREMFTYLAERKSEWLQRAEQQLQDQVAQLNHAVESVTHSLDTVHQSRSWTLTKPLRLLGKMFC